MVTQPGPGQALTELFAEKSANDIYNSFSLPKTQHERFIQLQQEMVGSTARVARVSAGRDPAKAESARREEQGRDWLRNMSQSYQNAYWNFMDRMDKAEEQLRDQIERLEIIREKQRQRVLEMEQRTARLADGTAVLKDRYGRNITESGRLLTEQENAYLRQQYGNDLYVEDEDRWRKEHKDLASMDETLAKIKSDVEQVEDARARAREGELSQEQLQATPEAIEKKVKDYEAKAKEFEDDFEEIAPPQVSQQRTTSSPGAKTDGQGIQGEELRTPFRAAHNGQVHQPQQAPENTPNSDPQQRQIVVNSNNAAP